jgi:hypothetical protein
MSKIAVRDNEKLWQSIKIRYEKSADYGGVGWNARKAQLAVKEYKNRGGGYKSSISKKSTSLYKWTNENWQYSGTSGNSRYLPEKVIQQLSPVEKRNENMKKNNNRGKKIPYTKSVKNKMKNMGVF